MSKYNAPVPFPSNADYSRQAIELPGTRRPGQTGHYRTTLYEFCTLQSPGTFTTLVEVFEEGLKCSNNGPFLGHRPLVSTQPLKFADHYVWQSWPAVDTRRRAVGSALQKLFQTGVLGGGQLDTVGIWSRNTPEWQVVDLALHAYGKVGVSLYDTLGKDSVEYIINHAELSVVFATANHIPFLLKLAPRVPVMKVIVSMDPLSEETKRVLASWAEERNVKVMDLPELEELGAANATEPITPTADQLCAICYTSVREHAYRL
ncbi:hypothetical protein AcV5_006264 [Taiwanofungus camphoratus]|nr:hypothetical protein AcV5_006264 [Antrodia cinnamomea]KAI0950296.1 hypothetical protein AcV7_008809 [Antrodia cinnamomea]